MADNTRKELQPRPIRHFTNNGVIESVHDQFEAGEVAYSINGERHYFRQAGRLSYLELPDNVGYRQKVIDVTATQLRTLAASPVKLTQPAAGVYQRVVEAFFLYTGGSNVFDSVGAGDDLVIAYGTGGAVECSERLDTTDDIDFGSTDDAVAYVPGASGANKIVSGADLYLHNVGTELATTDDDSDGDGTLQIIMRYAEYAVLS
jgi:hypothetical protein